MKPLFLSLLTAAALLNSVSLCAKTIRPQHNMPAGTVRYSTPIMGWSSWNTYRVNINETLIRRQADAMVKRGLKAAGYTNIHVDDGFFGPRRPGGLLQSHPTRFPNGMRQLTDYIHSLGLKAGIYSDAGRVTCGSIWDADSIGIGAGLYGHEEMDADLFFNQWNFDFIKIDYCGAGQELDLDEEQRYETICETIRNTAHKPISINICRWAFPGTWAARMASSWRISPDISPQWSSIRSIIDRNKWLSAYAQNGKFNDMDMLEVGRGMSHTEDETHFAMWCIMASPLLIGSDLTTLTPQTLALLTNPDLIALNQDPLGKQAHVVKRYDNGAMVFVKDLMDSRLPNRAVALYNPTDKPQTISVMPDTLELAGRITVNDLLLHKHHTLKAGQPLTATVLPHGVKVYKLEAEQRLISTRYEAEWAFLPLYDELGKRKKQIHYTDIKGASLGAGVTYIGGSEKNTIRWNNIYAPANGKYRITIRCCNAKGRTFSFAHNGTITTPMHHWTVLTPQPTNEWQFLSVECKLAKGNNTIILGSPYAWAPDVDYITVKPIE